MSSSPAWATDLAKQIRARRRELQLSQVELAELAGCGPDFLYDVERGKPSLRLDKLVPVLDVLGLQLTLVPRAPAFTTDPGEWLGKSS